MGNSIEILLLFIFVHSVDLVLPGCFELLVGEWAILFWSYLFVLFYEIHQLQKLCLFNFLTIFFIEVIPDIVEDFVAFFSYFRIERSSFQLAFLYYWLYIHGFWMSVVMDFCLQQFQKFILFCFVNNLVLDAEFSCKWFGFIFFVYFDDLRTLICKIYVNDHFKLWSSHRRFWIKNKGRFRFRIKYNLAHLWLFNFHFRNIWGNCFNRWSQSLLLKLP